MEGFFDGMASRWDEVAVHPAERVERTLAFARAAPGERVLDIGCGTGVLIPYLRALGAGRIAALDCSSGMIARARAKNGEAGVDYVHRDFLRYEAPEPFDLAMAYSCYPHFPDRATFFARAHSLLREGGRLCIAHIESREAINSLHDSMEGDTSIPLPPVQETIAEAELAGFRRLDACEEAGYYLVLVEKAARYDQ